jgi:DNA-directed RNA polymerase subunit RPC12/RpoP
MKNWKCPKCGHQSGLDITPKTVSFWCGRCKKSFDLDREYPPSFEDFISHLSVEQKDGSAVPFEINETQEQILDALGKKPIPKMTSFKGRSRTGVLIVKNGRVVRKETP